MRAPFPSLTHNTPVYIFRKLTISFLRNFHGDITHTRADLLILLRLRDTDTYARSHKLFALHNRKTHAIPQLVNHTHTHHRFYHPRFKRISSIRRPFCIANAHSIVAHCSIPNRSRIVLRFECGPYVTVAYGADGGVGEGRCGERGMRGGCAPDRYEPAPLVASPRRPHPLGGERVRPLARSRATFAYSFNGRFFFARGVVAYVCCNFRCVFVCMFRKGCIVQMSIWDFKRLPFSEGLGC